MVKIKLYINPCDYKPEDSINILKDILSKSPTDVLIRKYIYYKDGKIIDVLNIETAKLDIVDLDEMKISVNVKKDTVNNYVAYINVDRAINYNNIHVNLVSNEDMRIINKNKTRR